MEQGKSFSSPKQKLWFKRRENQVIPDSASEKGLKTRFALFQRWNLEHGLYNLAGPRF